MQPATAFLLTTGDKAAVSAGGWRISEVAYPDDVSAAVAEYAAAGEVAWLDSAAGAFTEMVGEGRAEAIPDATAGVAAARSSLVCVGPLAVLEQFDGGPAGCRLADGSVIEDGNGWRLWRRVASRLGGWPPAPTELGPGWVGYLGYEMARQLERLPRAAGPDPGLPTLRLALFDRALVLDHARRRAYAVVAEGVRARLGMACGGVAAEAEWLARWNAAARCAVPPARVRGVVLRPEVERDVYLRAVRRALDYIAAGDIYQVNLSQRLRLEGVSDVLAAHAAVRRANPAPYAALLCWDGGAVLSASPELFLRVRDGEVLTRPIKGTRPRTGDANEDERQQRELLASGKEAAELAMIVDLHRNDLGRVCAFGSVQVVQPRRLETHPTVFHTVAEIVGRLAPGRDGLDLLAACFPAGSITGVPKIRAMEIIAELEPFARGAYTGAVGRLGLDGRMSWNVAIRTLQIREGAATLYVGGGIVADSDPVAEYEETLAKGGGIVRGLTQP